MRAYLNSTLSTLSKRTVVMTDLSCASTVRWSEKRARLEYAGALERRQDTLGRRHAALGEPNSPVDPDTVDRSLDKNPSRAIASGDLPSLVHQQRKRKLVSAFELLVTARAAGIHAEHHDATFLEGRPVVPQLTKLLASTGRRVHDVENKNDGAAAAEIEEPNGVALLVWKLKVRGLGADGKQLAAEPAGHAFILLNDG